MYVINFYQSKCTKFLKAMGRYTKLTNLGSYRFLVEVVLGGGVKGLTVEATLKVINLDEITNAEEQQCEVERPSSDIIFLGLATCGGQ